MKYDIVKLMARRKIRWKKRWVSGAPPLSFRAFTAGELENYRIYGNTVGGESVGDLVESGEHAGEYKVAVSVSNGTDTLTTPIYLPESIKMVGSEAEYIDYAEQKLHRVRKNLLRNTASTKETQDYSFVVDNDGTITIDGYFTNTYDFAINGTWNSTEEIIKQGNYTLSNVGDSITSNIRVIAYNLKVNKGFLNENTSSALITNSAVTYVAIQIPSGTHINNLKLKIMICKAEITDDTYEPYITDTELDVTLPALPTLTGTNVLSVGTEVQPSRVEVKGRIKAVGQETEPEP